MAPDDDLQPATPRPALPLRLTRLRVKNFRSIADIDIPLSPLTVLVGPNGSGKSNVVDALRFVRDVFARGLDQAVMDREGMGVIQRWGTAGIEIGVTVEWVAVSSGETFTTPEKAVEIPVEFSAATATYSFAFGASANQAPTVTSEELSVSIDGLAHHTLGARKVGSSLFFCKPESGWLPARQSAADSNHKLLLPNGLMERTKSEGYGGIAFDGEGWFLETQHKAAYLDSVIARTLFYDLNFDNLRSPQRLLEETPLEETGLNLAAVLRHLAALNLSGWHDLQFALRQAVGGFLATKLIYQTDTSEPRASYLGQESDGTIRMLGLLAALYQDPAQPFISIEEPEANIHPGALAVLAGVLDEASLRSQVLVTTHSPDMLDHLPAESFLVVEKVGDATHVGPLAAGQLASVRQRLFTAGELLRMEGLQRQPAPNAPA